jgi:hypothetical protein
LVVTRCAAVLAVVTLTSACGSEPPEEPKPPPRTFGTSDAHADRPGGTAHLVAVRVTRDDGYDRLVMEFADRVPSYTVGYRPLPARADASGREIPLPGASAAVEVSLNPATAIGWAGTERTYFGPSTVSADTAVITDAKAAGDFENVLTWVIGVRSVAPFDVEVSDGPPTLVVDVKD